MGSPPIPLLEADDFSLTLISSDGRIFPVLEDIRFILSRGETMGIAGESGSGKTVLALSLLGLLPRSCIYRQQGVLCYDGINLLNLNETEWQKIRGRRIAMVFQEPMTAMNPLMTLYEQVAEGVQMHFPDFTGQEVRQRVHHALKQAGFSKPETFFDSYPHQLSGGMRQRAMLAMALATQPELIIADEPTTALDAALQVELLQELRRIVHEKGHSLIFISHDLGVIRTVADRLAVLYAGIMVELGPVSEVLDFPLHPYTRALCGAMPRLIKQRILPRAIPGHLPAPDQKPSGCVFATRCYKAAQLCHRERPTFSEPISGHIVQCHFPEQKSG